MQNEVRAQGGSALDQFPPEFVLHLHPLLHVGGLDEDDYPDPAFATLVSSLRKAFTAKAGSSAYDNTRGQAADFHVVLVDRDARFPPRKGSGPSGGHSPLSPLSPASPLYPDGLMAPIWIRKHRDLVPAAFVLVSRLWEPSLDPSLSQIDPLAPGGTSQIEEQERKHDARLVGDILERKKQTAERGIKLAIVLLASRKMLEDANLDVRLGFIRRQSSLDTRASLFVISPVAASEVVNFVASLRGELYEGAVDYYREHGRRARRKRSRVPTNHSRPIGQSAGPAPLGPQAWSVRYDYKMATFAELRQEIEVATKHYEDCYEGLLDLFSSAAALPARSKRWLEAKVLADCINAKICKFYLYTDESDRCLVQLNKHIARFRTLCDNWSIGEDTFEYWSWLTKQYRLFADLLDLGLRGGFRLPVHRPLTALTKPGLPPPAGLNPSLALLHPGYYYYVAAQCAESRKLRFKAVQEIGLHLNGNSESHPNSKAVEHERQIKHDEQIIELYTKAYDCFKRFKATRISLFIAAAIAGVHLESENFSIALRFFERIVKTYRREDWRPVLEALLHKSYVAARQQQDVPAAARLALELLALGPSSPDFAIDFELGLKPILAVTPAPSDAQSIVLDESHSRSVLEMYISYWRPTATLADRVAFQLVLTATPTMVAKELLFARLTLHFAEIEQSFDVLHSSDADIEGVQLIELSDDIAVPANLLFTPASTKVFAGSICSALPGIVSSPRVVLQIADNGWTIELPLRTPPPADDEEEISWRPWCLVEDGTIVSIPLKGSPSVAFRPRTMKVRATALFDGPAYLGEHCPFEITVVNEDSMTALIGVDLLLQPPENETESNSLIIDDESPGVNSHTAELGQLEPGGRMSRNQHLRCDGTPGFRSVDVSVHAKPVEADSAGEILPLVMDFQKTLTIDAVHPLSCDFKARYSHGRSKATKMPNLANLSEPDPWSDAHDFLLTARLTANGPWPIEIVDVHLSSEDVEHRLREVESTLNKSEFPLVWHPYDTFGITYRLEIAAVAPGPSTGSLQVKWRRHLSQADIPVSVTHIPLPALAPPIAVPRVILSLASYAVQYEPLQLKYTILNPMLTRPMRISVQVEGGEPWAFSGPRKTAPVLILPASQHVVELTVIATAGSGDVALPVVRIMEHLSSTVEEQSPSLTEGSPVTMVRTRELPIFVEGALPGGALSIFIVPG